MNKKEFMSIARTVETVELTDAEREKATGAFIKLPCGITHYEMKGDGFPVVLTPGYSTPYYIYDKAFDALVKAGYRVLRYDLLGRGLSERVDAVYTPELFARQLNELTKTLLPDEDFALIGTSMGGTVTTTFCRLYPGKVRALVLFAPAGMDSFKPPVYMRICKVPVLGDIVFRSVAAVALTNGCAEQLAHVEQSEKDDYMRRFAACAKYKGFVRCTLSSLRNTILNTDVDMQGYRSVAQQKIPMLTVWGTVDGTMPYYQHDRLLETCPHTEFVTLEGSGHDFVYDEPERAMTAALPFLERHTHSDITAI